MVLLQKTEKPSGPIRFYRMSRRASKKDQEQTALRYARNDLAGNFFGPFIRIAAENSIQKMR